jgi:hypothetical protein
MAPAAEFEENDGVPTIYHSFAGFTDGMGDTQPMETQVFRTASNLGALFVKNDELEDENPGAANGSEACPVNLVGSVEEEIDIEISSIPEESYSPNVQFKMPKTPAAAGQKRDILGNVVSSVTRTSSSRGPTSALKRMFGNEQGAGDISLTQAFEGTQNISSPVGALRSDPVFDRPSPNFHLDQSSPVVANTSFQAMFQSTTPNNVPSDPLNIYRTMKESQEEREWRLQQDEEDRRRSKEEDGLDDSLLMSVPGEILRRQRDREKEKYIIKAWSNFRSPGSTVSKRRPKSAGAMFNDDKIMTPARKLTNKKAVERITISDSVPESGSDDESEAGETDFAPTSVMQVPMTSSRGKSQSEAQVASSPPRLLLRQSNYVDIRSSQEGHLPGDLVSGSRKDFTVADSQRMVPEEEIRDDQLPSTHDVTSTQDSETRIVQSQYPARVIKETDASSISGPQTKTLQLPGNQLSSSPPVKPGENLRAETMELGHSGDEEINLVGGAKVVEKSTSTNLGVENEIPCEEQVISKAALTQEVSPHEPTMVTTMAESDPNESPNYHPSTDLCARQPSGFDSKTNQSESTSKATTMTNTNVAELFDTARSHFSPSTRTRPTSQVEHVTQQSPVNSKLRKLTEIAEDPTSQLSLPSVNLDINVLNADDNEFLDAMAGKFPTSSFASSPIRPATRRRQNQTKPLSEPAKNVNIVEPENRSSAESGPANSKGILMETDCEDSEDDIHDDTAPLKQKKILMKPRLRRNGKLVRPSKESTPPKPKTNISQSTVRQRHQKQTAQGSPKNSEAVERQSKQFCHSNDGQPNSLSASNVLSRSDEDRRLPSNDSGNAQDDISVPNRVFAYFGGNFMAYFPATYLGGSHLNGLRVEVRFDDGTVALLERSQIRKLELRSGDLVKIDRNAMRKKTFVLRGFKDRIDSSMARSVGENGSEHFPLTDIQGFRTVVLEPNTRASTLNENGTMGTIDVPVTDIYLTGNLWPRFANRLYEPASFAQPSDFLHTPSEMLSPPGTPSSRSRRQHAKDAKQYTHSRDSFDTSIVKRSAGLFNNMAFAITLAEGLMKEKAETVKEVLENGGAVLGYGFDELFYCTENVESRDDDDESDLLRLKPWARNMGFTALIADCASRRPKYMQALALNLPCVHFRWVSDCVKEKKVLPWGKYLLPAGGSAFLFGAVRSRNLIPYDPLSLDARLENVLARRERLIEGKNVLFVTGKSNLERRKAYEFVTVALGAKSVTRVRDLNEARKQVVKREFDWIYLDGDAKEAEIVVLSKGRGMDGVEKGNKRKRDGDGFEASNGHADEREGNVKKRPKFVSGELVMQSLILGALIE